MESNTLEQVEAPEKATTAVKRSGLLRAWLNDRIKRGENRVFTERMTVTPELAIMLLERNKENRKLRPVKLAQLKADMNAGNFNLNGETVKIAKTGELNDGQHRLQAIVETNKPQDILLCFGVERNSRFTVDVGAARSAGDHLSLSGWPYASQLAAVARMVISYERNDEKIIGRTNDISSSEVMERVSKDKLMQECVTYAAQNQSKFRKLAKASVIGFCFYEFAKRKPLQAKTFMESLKSGVDLSEHSPVRILREKLLVSPRLSAVGRVELFLRAWNAWIKDASMKQLRFTGNLPAIER